ncbi:MAG: molybdenum cofactor guanylyltransferase, partial [Calditrichaeota bacterium]
RDIYPDCGPLGGLYTALYYSPRPLVAILPCDMPLLEPQVYRILLENAFSDRPVVAVSHLGLEPLVSVWPVEPSLSVIDKNLKNQKYSFRETIEELKAVKINIQAAMAEYRPEMFININYRDDLRKLEFNLKDKNDFRRP